jgi:hypothetical protein
VIACMGWGGLCSKLSRKHLKVGNALCKGWMAEEMSPTCGPHGKSRESGTDARPHVVFALEMALTDTRKENTNGDPQSQALIRSSM